MAIPREEAVADFANKDTPKLKTRKSPVPQKVERITAGALKLELEERITLRDELTISIDEEMEDRKIKLDQGKADFEKLSKLVNGKE